MRVFVALVLLVGAVGIAEASLADVAAAATRSLLQSDCSSNPNAPGCKTCSPSEIPGCATCRYERVDGSSSTQTKCVTCNPGHQLNADRTRCGCAPGWYRPAGAAACIECGKAADGTSTLDAAGFYAARFCGGGFYDESGVNVTDVQPVACAAAPADNALLGTLIITAVREDQCVTRPGVGMVKDGSGANKPQACAADTFNPGKNRRKCRPCGRGLKTDGPGKSALADCKAPAGFYFDKNTAKQCAAGTWKAGLTTDTKCQACPPGITTAQPGATQLSDCNTAKRGYYLKTSAVSAGTPTAATAELCPINTFTATDNQLTACTPCSTVAAGLITLKAGAGSSGLCVAPPGVGKKNDTLYSECEAGKYKAGYNRNECKDCPAGFTTKGTGAKAFSDCMFGAGFGTESVNGTVRAVKCKKGFYGAADDTFGVLSQPCQPCPDGMTTTEPAGYDEADPTTYSNKTGPNACVTLAGYGYEAASLTAKKCLKGFWSAGGDRTPCQACKVGYSTGAEGASSEANCTISGGWGYSNGTQAAMRCPVGTWNDGSKQQCQICPDRSTTIEGSVADSRDDCSLCAQGFGKQGVIVDGFEACTACAPGYFSQGFTKECQQCPAGTNSAKGSGNAEDCYQTWQDIPQAFDNICTSKNVTTPHTSLATCRSECEKNANCMYYMWDKSGQKASPCLHVIQPTSGTPTARVGFKIDTGVYQLWDWFAEAGWEIGSIVASAKADAAQFTEECVAACDEREACVIALWRIAPLSPNGIQCELRGATVQPEYTVTQFRLLSSNMFASIVPPNVPKAIWVPERPTGDNYLEPSSVPTPTPSPIRSPSPSPVPSPSPSPSRSPASSPVPSPSPSPSRSPSPSPSPSASPKQGTTYTTTIVGGSIPGKSDESSYTCPTGKYIVMVYYCYMRNNDQDPSNLSDADKLTGRGNEDITHVGFVCNQPGDSSRPSGAYIEAQLGIGGDCDRKNSWTTDTGYKSVKVKTQEVGGEGLPRTKVKELDFEKADGSDDHDESQDSRRRSLLSLFGGARAAGAPVSVAAAPARRLLQDPAPAPDTTTVATAACPAGTVIVGFKLYTDDQGLTGLAAVCGAPEFLPLEAPPA